VHAQGEGEVDDVLAAAKWLQVHSDKRQVWLAYSFGALMAAKAALNFSGLNGAFFVSPALALEPLAKWNNDNNKLTIISGDKDEYSQLEDLKAYCQAQSAPVNLVTLKGVDHFYVGNESALIRLTKDYLADLF
jgi:hypothetical protein